MNFLLLHFKALWTLAAFAAFGSSVAFSQTVPPKWDGQSPRALADFNGISREKIPKFIDGFIRASKVADRSSNDLGWDCLAAVALYSEGDTRAVERLKRISEELSADSITDPRSSKAKGWGASIADARCTAGGYDAFSDGTCNGTDTVYAFQSGLGISCLASSAKILANPSLLSKAKDVAAYWQKQTLAVAPCKDCIYYATSDNSNDAGRYVRNMNVFIALGNASIAYATGEKPYADAALKAMRSELAERKSGNRGYLGKLDAQWLQKPGENERIENHSAAIAVLSLQISQLIESEEIKSHATTVWRDWATCSNDKCLKAGCKYWSGNAQLCQATHTGAHCAFRLKDPVAAAQCSAYLEKITRLPSFGVWSSIIGGKNN